MKKVQNEMSKWVRAAFIPALGIVLAGPVSAAGDTAANAQRTASSAQSAHEQSYRGFRASALIGNDVKSPQGKNLGEISDLIVDMNSGKVRYAILKFDPGIFSGERLFAVPTTELKLGQGKDDLVYNMSRERLEKAGVEKSRWPKAAHDREYLAGLDRAYGIVQPSDDRRAFSVSELLGKDVNGRQGKEIGEIRDLVIDMNAQKVHYAVLAFDPSWVAPEKLFAFPLTAFTFTKDKDELALDVDKSSLQRMRSFDHTIWSAFTTPVFVADVDRYLVTVTPASRNGTQRTGTSNATSSNSSSSSAAGGTVITKSPNYTASMKHLQNAAQRLRESIQAMAQAPVGDRRNQAIKEARQALADTNGAMIQLPPELRTDPRPQAGAATGTTSSTGASGMGGSKSSMSEADYSRSMQQLQKSAQQLRESIQAMSQQPQGQRRDQAIKEAHQALYDTNQAMMQLPPDMRAAQ